MRKGLPGAVCDRSGVLEQEKFEDVAKEFNAQMAAALILHGERDYQVTLDDLQGWRDALDAHAGVTIKSYPTLNHLFLPGEGKSTPSEYERAGQIPDFVLDDIAGWINKANKR